MVNEPRYPQLNVNWQKRVYCARVNQSILETGKTEILHRNCESFICVKDNLLLIDLHTKFDTFFLSFTDARITVSIKMISTNHCSGRIGSEPGGARGGQERAQQVTKEGERGARRCEARRRRSSSVSGPGLRPSVLATSASSTHSKWPPFIHVPHCTTPNHHSLVAFKLWPLKC